MSSIKTLCVVATMAGFAMVSAALGYTGEKWASQAKLSIDQARTMALKVRPGKVTDQELEKEKGGSGLRYSFDVKADGAVYEVGVDAKTGNILENQKEGSHPD